MAEPADAMAPIAGGAVHGCITARQATTAPREMVVKETIFADFELIFEVGRLESFEEGW